MTGEKKKEIWRVVKFVLFSASAGIIQLGLFTLLNELCKWSYWPCYLIALVTSVVWNFTLNRKFTFKSANNVPKAMALVLCYYAVFTPISPFQSHSMAFLVPALEAPWLPICVATRYLAASLVRSLAS